MLAPSFRYLRILLITTLIGVAFIVPGLETTAAVGGINRQLNYQGRLLNASQLSVSDGTYAFKFTIYDAASGGNALWTAAGATSSPSTINVSVQNGLFSVQLGDTSSGQNAFDFDWHQDSLYLGVTVGADSEMSPRKRLTAVPYALMAESLQGQYASGTVATAGGSLFRLQQTSSSAATADRTTLMVQTSGTSNVYDYLIKASNGSDVFTVSRQGHTTTTGNFAASGNLIFGDASSDSIVFNGRIGSDMVPLSNDAYDLGSGALSWNDVYASGTVRVGTDVIVNGQSVCLANGTNCPSGATADLNWTYDATGDFVRNATTTTDFVLGSTTTSTAPLFFSIDGTSASSNRLIIGQNQNADISIGAATSSGLNSAFQFSGNDLFVAGDIGAASSVYANWIESLGTVSGTRAVFSSSTNAILVGNGTVENPAFAFASNPRMGVYTNGTSWILTIQGTPRFTCSTNDCSSNQKFVVGGNLEAASNSSDIGLSNLSWRRIYASSTVHAGGVTSTGHVNPFVNDTYDLGSGSVSWRNVYASGTMYVGTVSGTQAIFSSSTNAVLAGSGSAAKPAYAFTAQPDSGLYFHSSGLVGVSVGGAVRFACTTTQCSSELNFLAARDIRTGTNNSFDIGQSGTAWRSIYASSTVHAGGVTSTGNINPFTNDLYNLGSGSASWNDVFASGTGRFNTLVVNSSTNAILVGDGTATQPSISFINDPDVGIYRPGTNNLGLAAGSQISLVVGPSTVAVTALTVQAVANNQMSLGAASASWKDVYASGTARIGTDVVVNGQSVCLEDGTNCPAGADLNWTYDGTGDFVRNATATTDLVLGSTATSTAPLFFSITGASASSNRLIIGQNQNADVVIGATTSSGLNSLFQFSGNDLFVAGNIGSASSVYTNGSFIAGSASTHFGDGFVNKTDGALNLQVGGSNILTLNSNSVTTTVSISPSGNSTLDLGNQTNRFRRLYSTDVLLGGITVLSSPSTFTGASTTRPLASGFGSGADQAFVAREFAFDVNGSVGTPTLSLIEGTTGTLQLWNTSLGGYAGLLAGTVTSSNLYVSASGTIIGGLGIGTTSTPQSELTVVGNIQNTLAWDSPLTLSSSEDAGAPSSVYVQGNYAYVTDTETDTIRIIDISDPSHPTTTRTFASDTADPYDIAVAGSYAVVTSFQQVTLYDITTSTPGLVVAANGSAAIVPVGVVKPSVAISGDIFANTNPEFDNVTFSSLSNPDVMAQIEIANIGATPSDVALQGRYAYVTAFTSANNFFVLDLDVANQITTIGQLDINSGQDGGGNEDQPIALAVQGRFAYVAHYGSDKLSIIDISNPRAPTSTAHVSLGAEPYELYVSGRYAYVVNSGGDTMSVVDISSSTAPVVLQNVSTGASSFPNDVFVSGRHAYVTASTTGLLRIIDIGGVETNGLKAASAEFGTLKASGNAFLSNDLFVNGSVNVGPGGLSSHGPIIAYDSSSSTNSAGAFDPGALFATRNCNDASNTAIARFGTTFDQSRVSIRCNGQIFADSTTIGSGGDYAEFFPTTDLTLTTGEVVAMTSETATSVKRAMAEDRPFTLGVISAEPLILGNAGPDGAHENNPNYKIVGLLGQLPVKASGVNGPIRAGDKLMAGDDGYAVRASGVGMILGQAMESLTSSTGMVMAYIEPGWSADGVFEASGSSTNILASGTASSSSPTFDSLGITFQGSAWNAASSSVVTPSFTLLTQVFSATSSLFAVRGANGGNLLTISDLGNASVTGDFTVGRRLFLGSKSGGTGSTSTYIYADDTQSPSSTYIATNADGWSTNSTYDYAERFYSAEDLAPGDLVIADPNGIDWVKRSTSVTDPVIGIVSTKPGFITGANTTGTHPIALTGRVPTRVSTKNGPITAGDQLAPSDIPGVAVKAIESGPVVGIALESYDSPNEGKISVFVQPGWRGGAIEQEERSTSITNITYTTEYSPGVSPRSGLATILAGSKEVNVSFESLQGYPLVTVTPYGQVSRWWLTNVSDHGFTIVISEAPTFDLLFSWKAEPSPEKAVMSFSDGTSANYDPTSGQVIVSTTEESAVEEVAATSSSEPAAESTTSTDTEPVTTSGGESATLEVASEGNTATTGTGTTTTTESTETVTSTDPGT